jgi:predicted RNA binding protein YcfA (HicA-like mRNA interferase family)
VSAWRATKAPRVLAALLRIGWTVARQRGSHRTLTREGWAPHIFAWHDNVEIGPKMLSRIGKETGLRPDDI